MTRYEFHAARGLADFSKSKWRSTVQHEEVGIGLFPVSTARTRGKLQMLSTILFLK